MAFDVQKIEEKLDRTAAGSTEVVMELGGIRFQNMLELMEFSKLMSLSGVAVPPHLRANPGACLAVCIRALRWGMDPFGVAEKTYLVNNKGVERIAYEAQLVMAVCEARAPIKGKLRHRIDGGGDDAVCVVWATPIGEDEAVEYRSPRLGDRKAKLKRNDYGEVKGSPLWDAKPLVQLAYDTVRDFVRLHFPGVLMGVYTPDELDEHEQSGPKDVTPQTSALKQRLEAAQATRGTEAAGGFLEHSVQETINVLQNGNKDRVPVEAHREPVDAPKEAPVSDKAPARKRTQKAAKGAADPNSPPPNPSDENPAADTPSPATPGGFTPETDTPPTRGGDRPEQTEDAGEGDTNAQVARKEVVQGEPSDHATDSTREEVVPDDGENPTGVRSSPRHETQPPEPEIIPPGAATPTTAAEYETYCLAWIDRATNADDAEARYDDERDLRDGLKIPIPRRSVLSKALNAKIATLRGG